MVEFLLGVPGRLVALGTTLATGVSDILTAIGTRAPGSSAVSNAVLTDARIGLMDHLANIASAPARIKSIQRGTVGVASGAQFASVTLGTTVDPSKSIVINLGSASVGNNLSGSRLELVDGTIVRGWSGGGPNAIDIGYQIVEFW